MVLAQITSPATGEKVEGDGTADDLLHVGADDRQLHHQPQDDTRHLDGRHLELQVNLHVFVARENPRRVGLNPEPSCHEGPRVPTLLL